MTSRKSLQKRLTLTALACTGLSLAVVQAPAQAATSGWNLKGTVADVVGAHAYGRAYRRGDTRVQVNGTLIDTKKDGKLAMVQLRATYKKGAPRYERDITGSRRTLGSEGGYNFAPTVQTISARECLVHRLPSGPIHVDRCASGWWRIW
jgi:hypothetical protein